MLVLKQPPGVSFRMQKLIKQKLHRRGEREIDKVPASTGRGDGEEELIDSVWSTVDHGCSRSLVERKGERERRGEAPLLEGRWIVV